MNVAVAAPRRPRERLLGSDCLRAVATVWVVVIHASAWGPGAGYSDTNLIARFSVPVFTVLTGVLLAYRYGSERVGSDFARRRLARTIVPWLSWIPVYIAFDITVVGSLHPSTGSLLPFIAHGGGHLWYLLLIPELYVVFVFWPRRHVVTAAVVALLVQTGLALWRVYGPFPEPWLSTLILEYGFVLFPFWLGFFAAGVAIGRLWRPVSAGVRRTIVLLGPLAIAGTGYLLLTVRFDGAPYRSFISGTGAFLDPVLPLFVLSIAAWILALGPAAMRGSALLRGAARTVADYSLGIYIIHPIALWYLGKWYGTHLQGQTLWSGLWFLVLVSGSFLFALIVSRLIALTPLASVIGMTRRPFRLAIASAAASA